ncbi:hypothetical protein NFI96_014592 [Prochilodus magdalenae]|nr:hypothetical protein NFI96_014592 [Prochilodus magdalenae]
MYQDGRTSALYFAVSNGNTEAAAKLLNAGASPNLDYFRPVLVALRQGSKEMVELLVENGADVNAYIPYMLTTFPATVALCINYLPLLKLLLDNGCDVLSCFQCKYGSKSHPPLKSTSKDAFGVDRDEQCMQFCEVISHPMVCRWAGPIIDLLLDYVGHVKLCLRLTQHLDHNKEWACIKDRTRKGSTGDWSVILMIPDTVLSLSSTACPGRAPEVMLSEPCSTSRRVLPAAMSMQTLPTLTTPTPSTTTTTQTAHSHCSTSGILI